jgi:hypothetical protein
MMGIFGYTHTLNYAQFERDLDFVVEINNDDKPRMKMVSFKKQKANEEALYYCYYLILLKLFVRENFSTITHTREDQTEFQYMEMVERVLQDLCCTTPTTTPEVLRIIEAIIDDQARPAAGAGMQGGDGAGMQGGDGAGMQGGDAGADGMPNAAGDGAGNAAAFSEKRQKIRQCEEEKNSYLTEAKQAHNVSHFMYNLQKAGQKCLEIQNIYREAYKQALTKRLMKQ